MDRKFVTRRVCEILGEAGFDAYIVGGTVRDRLLTGRTSGDIDIATDATPKQVKKLFSKLEMKVIPVGEKFGTVQVLIEGGREYQIEITTYRSEGKYTDKRHPDEVKFEKDLIKDLERRDFTMNAIAFDPINRVTIDPFNGIDDIDAGIIRAVGNPTERFEEDPLRMMRMCRFSGKLGFLVEQETLDAGIKLHKLINKIPAERIRDELLKILGVENLTFAFHYLRITGLLKEILPEVARLRGIPQPRRHHKFDVLTHSIQTVSGLPRNKPYLRLAGLLHDIGKLEMAQNPPYFAGHDNDGVKMAKDILKRLKVSNTKTDYVLFIIKRHMDGFNSLRKFSKKSARRYLSKIENVKWLPDLHAHIVADIIASGYWKPQSIRQVDKWMDKLFTVMEEHQPFTKKDLVINGHDLIKLGIPPSATLGRIQQSLLEEVIENPDLNTREYLLKRAGELFHDL